jgi:two-component system, cell cycle sensor histidine kinase and response regulator CckA
VRGAAPTDHEIILALGDDLPVGLWVARAPDGELVYANRMYRELMGAPGRVDLTFGSASELPGVYRRDGAPYPEHKLPFARALAERRVVIVDDIMVRRRDGQKIDVRAIARPIGNPVTHVVVAWFDVSRELAAERARAESEQRLRRAQRLEAVGTLAGGIAHDFNNLIFGIKLLAAELAAGEHDARRKAALDSIDEITERSATLTRSLLGFTRRTRYRAISVGLNDIVTSMTELLVRTLPGVELTFELAASDRGAVVGEHAQLEQVVMNLVLNARDAVQGAGRVVVRTLDHASPRDPTARFVALEIEDDGPGLDPEARERLFEPHVATAGAADPDACSPLGLETVFGIVDSHAGSIEVDARPEGRGTKIRVVLPAAPRVAAPRPRAASELPRGTGLILVVDDDQMVRKVVSGSLTALGYQTLEAESGRAAIAAYRAHHDEIVAVVLDMVMPDMPGRMTYLGLREIDRDVAVLLMSGHGLNDQVQEILDLGVRGFVTKPYSIADLATAIAALTR